MATSGMNLSDVPTATLRMQDDAPISVGILHMQTFLYALSEHSISTS